MPLKSFGTLAAKPTNPTAGDEYTALDTKQRFTSFVDGAFNEDAVPDVSSKEAARVASVGNVSIASAPAAIDGVTLALTNRVLLKDQSVGSENGIYIFNGAASAMTRALDADENANVKAGLNLFATEGTVNADTGWLLTTNDPIVVGTTALTFEQFDVGAPPAAHAGDHQDGGSDEINVGGLSGLLADPQTPAAHTRTHASTTGQTATDHHDNANDPTAGQKAALVGTQGAPSGANPYASSDDDRIPRQPENDALVGTDGTASGTNRYVTDSDPRNSNARAPLGHSHPNSDLTGVPGAGIDLSAIHDDVAGEIAAVAEKAVPIAADVLLIEDSAAANVKKRVQVGDLPIVAGTPDFAQLSDSTNQNPSVTTPVPITLNTNDAIQGISHSTTVDPDEITVNKAGSYIVAAQAQLGRTGAGTAETLDIFLQVNRAGGGFVDEPNSNIKYTIKDQDLTDVIVSVFTLDLASGDKFRFMQRVSDETEGLGLKATAAEVGPPTIPATPSIIMMVQRVPR